jgi:hypothetical protein
VYSVFAGLLIVFGGRVLAGVIIGSGSGETAEVLSFIRQFQIVNGSLYWLLGTLFIVRNSVQGLGYSGITMLAGVGELVARAAVAFMLVPHFGFTAICFANPLAWFAADVMLIIMLVRLGR